MAETLLITAGDVIEVQLTSETVVIEGAALPLGNAAITLEGTLPTNLVCLLYTSDAADERSSVDLGGRRIIKKKNTADKRGDRRTNKTMNRRDERESIKQ